MPRVVVVGSANIDMVVCTPTIPRPGETVIGSEFLMVPGGKGANQAVAAARLGAQVVFIARVGNDLFGEHNLQGYLKEGIDCRFVQRDTTAPSGIALIAVDTAGQNAIVVAPGANMRLTAEDVLQAEEMIAEADVVLAQLEVPIEAVTCAAQLARKHAKRMVLNPAPAPSHPLPPALIECVDVLTPNESEARMLTGSGNDAPIEQVGTLLAQWGVPLVVITLGAQGVLIQQGAQATRQPAYRVPAVDTTAAGDAFAGALAVALAEGKTVEEAVQFAQRVAALSVTQLGAQTSLPTRDQVEAFLPDTF